MRDVATLALLPAVTLVGYLVITRAPYNVVLLCVVTGFACSTTALFLWLRSNWLANQYIAELDARSAERLRRKLSSTVSHTEVTRKDERGRTLDSRGECVTMLPHRHARIAPVLPAFFALCFLLASIASLASAIGLTIFSIFHDVP